jgi:hypothetical protein
LSLQKNCLLYLFTASIIGFVSHYPAIAFTFSTAFSFSQLLLSNKYLLDLSTASVIAFFTHYLANATISIIGFICTISVFISIFLFTIASANNLPALSLQCFHRLHSTHYPVVGTALFQGTFIMSDGCGAARPGRRFSLAGAHDFRYFLFISLFFLFFFIAYLFPYFQCLFVFPFRFLITFLPASDLLAIVSFYHPLSSF